MKARNQAMSMAIASGVPQAEVALRFGLSRERVRQIHMRMSKRPVVGPINLDSPLEDVVGPKLANTMRRAKIMTLRDVAQAERRANPDAETDPETWGSGLLKCRFYNVGPVAIDELRRALDGLDEHVT